MRSSARRGVATLRGDAPTGPLPKREVLRRTPYRDPRLARAVREERDVEAALDLALGLAETMVRCGAGAPQVEATIVAVATAAGITDYDYDITLQSLLVQARTPSGQWVTRLRVVRDQRRDFARLARAHHLVDELVSGRVSIAEAAQIAEQNAKTPRMWSAWVVAIASGLVAAGVAMMIGAGFQATIITLLSAILVEGLTGRLARNRLPDFYLSAVGGFLALALAWTAYALGGANLVSVTPADFAAIMAGGIVALLPARSIASALEDVIMGYWITGTARIFAVFFHTLGLILGVAAGLAVVVALAQLLHLELSRPSVERLGTASASLPLAVLGAAIIGFTGAVTMQSSRRFLLPSAAVTAMGVCLVWLAEHAAPLGRVTAVGIAALVIGFVCRVLALRLRAPAMVLAVPASFGLLPGLSIFVGLYRLMVPADGLRTSLDVQVGVQGLASALGVLVAIAAGTTLGDLLAAPLDSTAWQRRRAAAEPEES